MGIDETRRDQGLAIVMDTCLRVVAAQRVGLAHGQDASAIDQDAPARRCPGGFGTFQQGIARKPQDLAQK